MMAIKCKAKMKDGMVEVKALMKHEMETGLRKDSKTGEPIPAHHITEVVCMHDGSELFRCNMGPAISKNPYLSFTVSGPNVGDTLQLSYVDNMGESDSGEAVVK
ncbi:MAG: thiosulfate oxidation carrier complex protein SoxZ [Gammaproteobacteria bacterium]|nr:thiosulfate oxidation carrier complex protein SoxZ [Gammaproteobacteria bacterium]MCY4226496.1 thiosulfate oxidation carrier complex protein SoxZ [Gammaproteobacteria bacterium]MCY4312845.1 thiosulfate oxidation carrier complex protein SoxZ [Gammaproteobacteria bacterium]